MDFKNVMLMCRMSKGVHSLEKPQYEMRQPTHSYIQIFYKYKNESRHSD